MNNRWYKANFTNKADQGLVADEITGENVAVVYKSENTNLIASAPEMYELLERLYEQIGEDLIDNTIDIMSRYNYELLHTEIGKVLNIENK